jgi:hypothetical protein
MQKRSAAWYWRAPARSGGRSEAGNRKGGAGGRHATEEFQWKWKRRRYARVDIVVLALSNRQDFAWRNVELVVDRLEDVLEVAQVGLVRTDWG